MAEYQKYMFDNFVVSNFAKREEENVPSFSESEETEDVLPEETLDDVVEETTKSEEVVPQEPVVETAKIINTEPTYSKEELDAAVKLAEEKAYEKGISEAMNEEAKKQDLLLEDISNRLKEIFANIDKKAMEMENSSLHFAVELLRKLLPTLEQEQAEAEVKNFMARNFANFAAQETLSFAFNPETISLVSDSIGRLAEQNDFEGKIAVHKDASLGPSDCRIEWKSGGVERKVSASLDKVEDLIENNMQERENGKQS